MDLKQTRPTRKKEILSKPSAYKKFISEVEKNYHYQFQSNLTYKRSIGKEKETWSLEYHNS